MNATHYHFSETVLSADEIRKTKIRHSTGQDCRISNLKYPIIDWVAWWRQLYRLNVQLLSAARMLLLSLFAFIIKQLINLKRYLMMKEELLAEAFYEAMDSFFVMDTIAEVILVAQPLGNQNFVSSGQRSIHVSVVAPESNTHTFSMIDDFSKSIAKANKPARWTNDPQHRELKGGQAKSLKQWFWKRWFNNAASAPYYNTIIHLFLKIRPITAHTEIGADYLKC
jgi:hypothetical protein